MSGLITALHLGISLQGTMTVILGFRHDPLVDSTAAGMECESISISDPAATNKISI